MTIKEIAIEWRRLKVGQIQPHGFKDAGGRWWPNFMLNCCLLIRPPSIAWPLSLINHCRSAEHLAAKYEVDVKELKMEIKQLDKEIKNDTKNKNNKEKLCAKLNEIFK